MPAAQDEEDASWTVLQYLCLGLLVWLTYTFLTDLQEVGRGVVNHVGEFVNNAAETLEQSLAETLPSSPPPSKFDQLMQETMDYLQRAFDN